MWTGCKLRQCDIKPEEWLLFITNPDLKGFPTYLSPAERELSRCWSCAAADFAGEYSTNQGEGHQFVGVCLRAYKRFEYVVGGFGRPLKLVHTCCVSRPTYRIQTRTCQKVVTLYLVLDFILRRSPGSLTLSTQLSA